jgi:hypothetical protein
VRTFGYTQGSAQTAGSARLHTVRRRPLSSDAPSAPGASTSNSNRASTRPCTSKPRSLRLPRRERGRTKSLAAGHEFADDRLRRSYRIGSANDQETLRNGRAGWRTESADHATRLGYLCRRKSPSRTLPRWRHGFKSCWDYAGHRPFPGVLSTSGPALAPRRARGREGLGSASTARAALRRPRSSRSASGAPCNTSPTRRGRTGGSNPVGTTGLTCGNAIRRTAVGRGGNGYGNELAGPTL